jgi:hypothetical protein
MANTPKTGSIDYTTKDPQKIAQQNRQLVATQGTNLDQAAQQRAQQATAQSGQTQDYLGDIENPLASGQGGYNPSETSQITMTPEQQQQMVTGAGISAGTNTAASVGAAERAAAASGGNPMAVAAYRARAAQQEGAQAGDAMTKARVAASSEAANRAENIGQTRIGQQNQGLNYYQGLQGQQNQNAQNAYGQQQQTYGTETGGLTSGANTSQTASQNPSTFDKVMGGIGGALSFLDEGDVVTGDTPAVVGENGPEKVVSLPGASPSLASLPHTAGYDSMMAGGSDGSTSVNPDGSIAFTPGAGQAGSGQQNMPFWKRAGAALKSNIIGHPGPAPAAQPATASPAQPARMPSWEQSMGQSIGKLGHLFLADGGIATGPGFQSKETVRGAQPPVRHAGPAHNAVSKHGMFPSGESQVSAHPAQGANGIFTAPTRVNLKPNEAVVPLSYRAGAKVRPSMAALPAAKSRQSYGGYGG